MSASNDCSSFISGLGKRGVQRKLVGWPLISSKHTDLWQEMYEEAKDGTITIKNENSTKTIIQMSDSKNKYAGAISSLNSKQVYAAFDETDNIILPSETYIVSDKKENLVSRLPASSNCYSMILDGNCIKIIDYSYNNNGNNNFELFSMITRMGVPDLFQLKLIATMNNGTIVETAPWIIEKSTAEAMTNFTRPCNNNSNAKDECNENSNVKIKKEKQEIGSAKVEKGKKLKATAFKRMSCGKAGLIENSSLGVKVLASEYNDDILYRDGTISTPLDRHFGILIGIYDSGMIENKKQMHLSLSYFKPTRLDFYLNENTQLDKLAAVIYYETTNVTIRSNVEKTSKEIVIGGSTIASANINDLNNNMNNNDYTSNNYHCNSIDMSSNYNYNHDNGSSAYQNVRQTNLREMGLSSPQSGHRFDPMGFRGFNPNTTLNTLNSVGYPAMSMGGTVVDNRSDNYNFMGGNCNDDNNLGSMHPWPMHMPMPSGSSDNNINNYD